MGVTYAIFDMLKETYWMLFQAPANNSVMWQLFSCILYESITIKVSKKVYVILCKLWICSSQKCNFFT